MSSATIVPTIGLAQGAPRPLIRSNWIVGALLPIGALPLTFGVLRLLQLAGVSDVMPPSAAPAPVAVHVDLTFPHSCHRTFAMPPNTATPSPRAHRMELPAMRADTFRAIVRASAIYDLIVTAPFMTPWSLMLAIGMIDYLHASLGLPGALPAFEATHSLFAGLMGSVVVVWSLARIHLGAPILGRYDAVARLLFALWQVYAVANGATPIILLFTVFEVLFGILQALPVNTRATTTTDRDGNG